MTTAMEVSSVDINEIEKAKQGKVTGVIIPPPDIRAVVDKTAQFVARNGKSFEKRILESGEGKTAKFNFMKSYDPYHAYYEMKISEFEGGKTTIVPPVATPTPAPKEVAPTVQTTTAKASFTTPIARFAMNKPKDPPPAFEFSVGHPSGLSALDIDVMKLTAQYTALNGREFLSGLAQREQRNPQFDFLKPTHMLFSYFTSLVDAYAKILQPSSTLLKTIGEKQSKMTALQKSVERWGWERAEEERRKQEAVQADADRSAFQSIDWYDFVVVETIEFREDELYEPASMLSAGGRAPPPPPASEEDMDMDEGDDHPGGVPPPPPPPPGPTQEDNDMDMDDEMEVEVEEDDSDLKVVTDYKPRIGPSGQRGTKLIDPFSGKAIPAEQMSEHMRVQLMDPRWRVENQRFLEKQKDTGYAEGGSIADSLKQFAKQRGDIFGSAEEETARLMAEESKRKKRVEETNQIIWDGHQSSLDAFKRQKVEQSTTTAAPAPPSSQPPPSAPSAYSSMPPTPQTVAPPPPPMPQAPAPSMAPPSMPMPAPPPPSGYYPFPHGMQAQPPSVAPPGMAPPPPPMQPAPSKESALVPEAEFAARYPDPITLHITVPSSSPNPAWNLQGQVLQVSIAVTSNVKDVKDAIGELVGGMPTNKQQLKGKSGFLKDSQTLAALNIGDGTSLEMSARSRGGKR